jgi:hypothetical protein
VKQLVWLRLACMLAVCVCMACAGTSNRETSPQAAGQGGPPRTQSANEPAPDLPEDELDRLRTTRVGDCNGNAIPDSVDIRAGFSQDVNHNGEIDDCDTDDEVAEQARSGGKWWRYADSPDSTYFSVTHSGVPRITIRYTVPPLGADVSLTVHDEAGAELGALVNQHQDNGPYIIQWDRKIRGQGLRPGTYTFRLFLGGKLLERKMGWRNW